MMTDLFLILSRCCFESLEVVLEVVFITILQWSYFDLNLINKIIRCKYHGIISYNIIFCLL